MKKTLILLATALVTFGCNNSNKRENKYNLPTPPERVVVEATPEKEQFDKVIKLHDEVMGYEKNIMSNMETIDSLLATNISADAKKSATELRKKLADADDAMTDWMHQFKPEYTNAEAMNYLKGEEVKIKKIDSLTKTAVKESWQFITEHKK